MGRSFFNISESISFGVPEGTPLLDISESISFGVPEGTPLLANLVC